MPLNTNQRTEIEKAIYQLIHGAPPLSNIIVNDDELLRNIEKIIKNASGDDDVFTTFSREIGNNLNNKYNNTTIFEQAIMKGKFDIALKLLQVMGENLNSVINHDKVKNYLKECVDKDILFAEEVKNKLGIKFENPNSEDDEIFDMVFSEEEIIEDVDSVFVPVKDEKEYIKRDNQKLKSILEREFDQQAVGNDKSFYAWKYKSGQEMIKSGAGEDGNQINVFFLGTSTPPLFGIHNIDVCETGHIISQLSLQKGLKKEPSLLVKGIGTIDMQSGNFPLEALDNPGIAGVDSGESFIYTLRKTKTTVKGVGVENRLALTMNDYFVPNLFQMVCNRSLENRGELTINLAGHSRGAITTFAMADCANKFIETLCNGKAGIDYDLKALAQSTKMSEEDVKTAIEDIKKNSEKIKIKICALDPVEGARSMHHLGAAGLTIPVKGLENPIMGSYLVMPPSVKEATLFFAEDERRSGFRPSIPLFSEQTQLNFIGAPGKHGTLTGNFGNDGNMGQFQYPASKDNKKFQDALLGIFDETLLTINKKLNNINDLPPFPLNTFRRIVSQSEYQNTKKLFIQSLDAKNKLKNINKLKDDDLIEMMIESMVNNKQDNIIFYDCLSRDAHAALEIHRKELRNLEKDWRHDTNVSASIDRDNWTADRNVYVRSKNNDKWEESKLKNLVPTYLPNAMHAGLSKQSVVKEFKNEDDDKMVILFYQLKNRIDTVAYAPTPSNTDVEKAIFDSNEFKEFVQMLPQVVNRDLAKKMVTELMIDLDYKYGLVESNEILSQLYGGIVFNMEFEEESEFDRLPEYCFDKEFEALKEFIGEEKILDLSLDETEKLSKHVSKLKSKNEIHGGGEIDFLTALGHRLDVKADIDRHIEALEAYIESKSTRTGQDVQGVKKLLNDLLQMRKDLPAKDPNEIKNLMDTQLNEYTGNKKFQGWFSSYFKNEPGSVAAIKKVRRGYTASFSGSQPQPVEAVNLHDIIKNAAQNENAYKQLFEGLQSRKFTLQNALSTDESGSTALHYLMRDAGKNVDAMKSIIWILTECVGVTGASNDRIKTLNLQNINGQTPLDIMRDSKNENPVRTAIKNAKIKGGTRIGAIFHSDYTLEDFFKEDKKNAKPKKK